MKKYFLNPDYKIRSDKDRYLLYNQLFRHYKSDEVKTFIHPFHAWILSLFSGGNSLENVISQIAHALNISTSSAQEYLNPWIENTKHIILNVCDVKVRLPRNLIIPENKILESSDIEKYEIYQPSRIYKVDLTTKRHETPYLLTLMLTNKCITKCCYCYADTHTCVSNYIPVKRIIEIIKEAKGLGIYNISLIGGEVFLHPHWDIILKEIVDNGFSPDIISTKIPITKSIISKIKDSGYKGRIQLSIDSFDPKIASETLLVHGNYTERLINGIELLDESDIPYKIETVLTKQSAVRKNIDQMFSFLSSKKNVVSWEIRSAMFSHYKTEQNFHDIKASKTDLMDIFKYLTYEVAPLSTFPVVLPRPEHNKEYFTADNGSSSFKGARCSALNQHLFILPDGKCTICEQLYWNPNFVVGDLNYQSIMEVWNSPRVHELLNIKQETIQRESACHDCNLFQDCFKINRNRCWSDVIKAYGTQNWDYPDPRCNLAPSMKHDITYK